MYLIILIEVMFLLFLKTGTCMWYLRYSNQSKSWKDAKEHCQGLNGSIFTVYNDKDAAFQDCSFYKNISSPLWTGRIQILSDWIEMNFCYQFSDLDISKKLILEDSDDSYSCSYYCVDTTQFAYLKKGNKGICLCVIKKPDAAQNPLCAEKRKYRLYINQKEIDYTYTEEDCSSNDCRCVYTKYINERRHFLPASCEFNRTATCMNEEDSDTEITWLEAKKFCETEEMSLLKQTEALISTDTDIIWTGIFKEYIYVWYENNRQVDPVKCMTINPKLSFSESDCKTPRNFICKLDINAEADIESDDCNIPTTELTTQRPSTEIYISSTEYSSTLTTDYMSTSTSSLPEHQTTSTSHSTETQTPSTSYSTENPTTPDSYSTEPQTSSTSFPTENFTVTTLSKPLSEHKQSEQFPTVIVGSVSGVMVITLIVLAVVLILVRRKKILSNKYRKHDRAEKTEKPEKDKTKGSPLPVGSSNVSGSKSDVYCDPWQSFEESQTLTNTGKKLNRQSQNPMYEMNSLQYDSYTVAGGLNKPNHTEKYENVNLDIYNHCNVGTSAMANPQQNLYDSAAGIYSHLNHGVIPDHNEDTYDHFHGSDQDYDQFDRTLRNTEESEYSIYQ